MNRNELAELLASTHGHLSKRQTREPRQHSTATSNALTADLSPRQLFQSGIRTLSHDGLPVPSPPLSPHRRAELQRLSSLRVHVTSPTSHVHQQSPGACRLPDARFGYTTQEPDFVAEERAAWVGVPREGTTSDNRPVLDSVSEERLSTDSSQSSDQSTHLQPFGPSHGISDASDRPRTSRGTSMPGTFPHHDAEPKGHEIVGRKSKFLEGSMNEKSVGLSSTWLDHGAGLSTDSTTADVDDDDNESTPRAGRVSVDSLNSTDVADFTPLTITPATIKQRLSRFASNFKSSESEDVTRESEVKPKRLQKKGLRKSISFWNFGNIGGKVKFFGATASDSSDSHGHSSKSSDGEKLDVLGERKRKAEKIYAEQFGTKKQKGNDGLSVEQGEPAHSLPPRTLKKRSVSAQRSPAARRRREVSSSTVTSLQEYANVRGPASLDLRKRPSRRELEKENQQLRALLREQQAQSRGHLQLSASRSSLHLPLEESDVETVESAITSTPSNDGRQKKTQKQRGRSGIPPVPPLPSRAVLESLGNKVLDAQEAPGTGTSASTFRQDAGTTKRVTRSAKLGMTADVGGENINTVATSTGTVKPRREEWEWPEDVF
ncbi:uncharacterized protein HMPREF1541_10299 [Cyphellophora europaea CBS 101466]|uniref:Uncharacterized protein n=1 Tax=Cyphellophora europaea (strain CBS 101466) TaxID=1220924 RepID=W2S9N0_CYPE1|nr:uncharacterized protein HMPREF1541_10299 [Cyphellophora europaea CBS 101466]ETN44629.1 hypothetical protein HMPREF1541_10299 [Cyphellophora europaea CBS 101466]